MKQIVASIAALALLLGVGSGRILGGDPLAFQAASSPAFYGQPVADGFGAGPSYGSAFSGVAPASYQFGNSPCGGPGCAAPGVPAAPGTTMCCPSADPTAAPCCRDVVEVTFGGLLLNRAGAVARDRTLVQSLSNGDTRIGTRDLQVDEGAGPRVNGIVHLAESWDVELLYFSVDSWARGRSASGPGLYAPALSQQLTFEDAATRYRSDLHNAEANLRLEINPRVSMLMGFRYVQLDEAAGLWGLSTLGSADTTSQLINDLYGFQLGADTTIWDVGCFRVNGFAKAGVFGNQISRWQIHSGSGPFANSSNHDTGTHTAFVGDASVTATWQFSDHLGIFGGYEAVWLTGVATAPDDLGSTGGINADFTVFYHGAVAGIQANW